MSLLKEAEAINLSLQNISTFLDMNAYGRGGIPGESQMDVTPQSNLSIVSFAHTSIIEQLKLRDLVESHPDGYPRLAALMDSDINTRLYRRFGLIRNRLLLHKQDQIMELSEKLHNLDKADETSYPDRLYCRRYDKELGEESQRTQVLQSLQNHLEEYDAMLLREHAIVSLPKPTTRNHRAIFDWVYNNKPVVREEYEYLYDERDFLLLGNQQDDWLRSFQERIWNLSFSRFFTVSPSKMLFVI